LRLKLHTLLSLSLDFFNKACKVFIIYYIKPKENTTPMKKILKNTRFWQVISAILFIAVIGSGGSGNAQELTDLKANLESIQEENDELHELYTKSINDLSDLNIKNEDLQKEISEQKSEIERLTQENSSSDNYEKQIQDLQTQVASLEEEKSTLSDQVSSLGNENSTLQSKVDEYENTINSLKESSDKVSSQEISSGDSGSSSFNSAGTEQSINNSGSSGGTIVYVTRTGNKYHRGSCSYLRQSKIEIDKEAAIAQGYGACSRCNP